MLTEHVSFPFREFVGQAFAATSYNYNHLHDCAFHK